MRRIPEDRSVIFMNATLVAKIAKNRREEIRIAVLKNNKIDIRTYFYYPDTPEPRPTRKGIWLSFKHVPPILAAFERFQKDPKTPLSLEFDQSDKEKIRVYSSEYMGGTVIHIRTFYLKDNEFQPGKGFSFAVTLLETMIAGFKKLADYDR